MLYGVTLGGGDGSLKRLFCMGGGAIMGWTAARREALKGRTLIGFGCGSYLGALEGGGMPMGGGGGILPMFA